MRELTLLSLFDGSGGFPLAASMCGIRPVACSEVEPYPIAVTKSRFQNMKHLGSVTDVHGGDIEPVDIITFGSPCQDLSVAGKRAGLKHEANGDDETTRSGLFMEAVRIIKEMREATNGEYPTFAVWENVPGAFSSNKGEDFRTVLEELIKIVEPTAVMPAVPKNGWPYSDSYCGDGWSLAYRVFDAQYWGVPQRRRRIYLVLDLRGQRAGKVLFEREGVRGHFTTFKTAGQETAGDAANRTGADDRADGGVVLYQPMSLREENWAEGEVKNAIRAGESKSSHCVVQTLPFDTTQVTSPQNGCNPKWGDPCHPLAAQGHPPTVICKCYDKKAYSIENHPADSRVDIDDSGKVQTLTSRMGTGGGNVPMVMEPKPVYCLQGSMIGREDKNGPQGDGVNEETSFTLNTIDRHAVAYQYIVRRLTPTECARLQGFPDDWGHPDHKEDFTDEEYRFWLDVRNTHAAINGKPQKDYTKDQMLTWYNKLHTDSAEYKMYGNGISLPTALYVMQGIAEALKGGEG